MRLARGGEMFLDYFGEKYRRKIREKNRRKIIHGGFEFGI